MKFRLLRRRSAPKSKRCTSLVGFGQNNLLHGSEGTGPVSVAAVDETQRAAVGVLLLNEPRPNPTDSMQRVFDAREIAR